MDSAEAFKRYERVTLCWGPHSRRAKAAYAEWEAAKAAEKAESPPIQFKFGGWINDR